MTVFAVQCVFDLKAHVDGIYLLTASCGQCPIVLAQASAMM